MSSWTTMFDASLAVAPGLGEPELASVPAKRGVMALLGEGDQPILLLTAADLRSRLRTRLGEPPEPVRKKSADLREVTRKILWKLSNSHFETDLHYFELARAIWPRTYTELLAWRPAWFVEVNPHDAYPHFARTREPGLHPALCLGPFESGAGAQKFIEGVEDAFDLCRDYQCLRQAPHGPACAYFQIGRCVGPCNGTISLEDYRKVVARAADFAAGHREDPRRTLEAGMKQASAAMQFEKAGAFKTRLDRLAEFNAPPYAHVAPLEQFRFLLVQPSGSRKRADVFLVAAATVLKAPPLEYPLVESQLHQAMEAMSALAQAPAAAPDQADWWRMGLVAHYLYAGPRRAGAIVRWRPDLSAGGLSIAIEAAAQALHLKSG